MKTMQNKNEHLVTARLARGWSGTDLARAADVDATSVSMLERKRLSPWLTDGSDLRPAAVKVAVALGVMPALLWPEHEFGDGTNYEPEELPWAEPPASPFDVLAAAEQRAAALEALDHIWYVSHYVLLAWLDGRTHAEIAVQHQRTKCRVATAQRWGIEQIQQRMPTAEEAMAASRRRAYAAMMNTCRGAWSRFVACHRVVKGGATVEPCRTLGVSAKQSRAERCLHTFGAMWCDSSEVYGTTARDRLCAPFRTVLSEFLAA